MIALATVTSPFSSGCLVTDDIEFQAQEDVPPSLVFRPRSRPPMGVILEVDTGDPNITNLSFALQVRDENVRQDLQTQIRMRTIANFQEVLVVDEDEGELIPGTGSATRDFEFSFASGVLLEGHCHQLELAISGEFDQRDDAPPFFPTRAGDLAVATWWIWETSQPVDPSTCPSDDFQQ